MPKSYKVPFPTFTGAVTNSEEIAYFFRQFEVWATNNRIDKGATGAEWASNLEYAMKGEAQQYIFALRARSPAQLQNYDALKKRIEERFSAQPTPSEIWKKVEGLKQLDHEKVQSFVDRCHIVQSYVDKDFATPANQQPNKQVWITAIHNYYTLQQFMIGVRPTIKAKLLESPDVATLDEVVKSAVAVERAETEEDTKARHAKVATVSPVLRASTLPSAESDEEEMDALAMQMDAIQVRRGFRDRGERQGWNNQVPRRGNRPQRGAMRARGVGRPARPDEQCHNCNAYGHFTTACTQEYNREAVAENRAAWRARRRLEQPQRGGQVFPRARGRGRPGPPAVNAMMAPWEEQLDF